MNYLLIAVLVLLVWNLFQGYKKGFMKTVFALVSWVIVLMACNIATPMVTDFLMEETEIAVTITQALEEKINEMIAESGVLQMEENIPDELQAALLGEAGGFEEILNSGGEMKVNSTSIVYTLVWIVAVILVIVVTRVALMLIDFVLGIAAKLPIIGSLDKVLGVLFGGAKGLLVCWLLLAVVGVLSITGANADLAAYITQSQFLTWMQDNNFILNMFVAGQ